MVAVIISPLFIVSKGNWFNSRKSSHRTKIDLLYYMQHTIIIIIITYIYEWW